MIFCNQCGQGNQDDAGFCVQCGAPLAESAAGTPETAPYSQPPAGTPETAGLPPQPGAAPPPPGAPAPPVVTADSIPGIPPPGYAPAPQYRTQVPTDPMAIASLVMGIVSWFFCPLVAGVLAIIFGYLGRRNIRESNGALQGEAFCTAGFVLGLINLGIILLVVPILLIVTIIPAATSNAWNVATPAVLAVLAALA